ncbi:MAG: sigma-70 family RNA polymerase sigma factor [Acidobacteria bacterium]|nr:MAG: sigma-70 family RNA polymerase sigma factor [Acidobacteriota bacterium]
MSVSESALSVLRVGERNGSVQVDDPLSSHRRFTLVANRPMETVERPPNVEGIAHPPESPERIWTQSLQEYAGKILTFLRSWGLDDDQVMDRFVYICEKLAEDDFRRFKMLMRVSHDGALNAWLWVVVKRLCINYIWSAEGRRRLPRAIARLSAFDRRVFELCFWKDSSPSEIYEELCCTGEFAVEFDRVFEALGRIFSCLNHKRRWSLLSGLAGRRPVLSLDRVNEETGRHLDPVDARPNPEEALLRRERQRRLQRAMVRLSSQERLLIELRYVEELSLKQIGEQLHMAEHQVKRSLRATLDKLRNALDGCCP